eukprot:Skav228318  [mRNA]  locus=scaffold3455:2219:3235:+ [translate_table: standard]
MAVAAVLGCALGFTAMMCHVEWPSQIAWLTAVAAVVGLCIQNDLVRTVLNLVCEMICWLEVIRPQTLFMPRDLWYMPTYLVKIVPPLFWLMSASFFCLLEIDRLSGKSTMAEAQQLRKGYTGSIQLAECARESDARKIRQEIAQEQESVDFAIHVLLTAGMSTPALRHIAEAGVDIEFAAYSEVTGAAVLLIPLELLSGINFTCHIIYFQQDWFSVILRGVCFIGRLILLVLICRSPTDERCFLLKLLSKLAAILVLAIPVCFVFYLIPDTRPLVVWLMTFDIGLLFVIPMAFLGMQRTAEMPGGLCMLQLAFARGTKAFYSRKSELDDSSSESSSSE